MEHVKQFCPIANCRIEVKEVRDGNRTEANPSSEDGCLNEYYFHDHKSGILWKFKKLLKRELLCDEINNK